MLLWLRDGQHVGRLPLGHAISPGPIIAEFQSPATKINSCADEALPGIQCQPTNSSPRGVRGSPAGDRNILDPLFLMRARNRVPGTVWWPVVPLVSEGNPFAWNCENMYKITFVLDSLRDFS
jgi:hypothetical protein